jgi:hypothetical protein
MSWKTLKKVSDLESASEIAPTNRITQEKARAVEACQAFCDTTIEHFL